MPHLFDEVGIDTSRYADNVEFVDPITKYDNISGYLFNIQKLRRLFRPDFELHDVYETAENELTTRWTMTMKFVLLPWQPEIAFTGVSIMTVDLKSGKFVRHGT